MGANDDHIIRLESEIRYLKGLLDENGISYDYEAYAEVAKRDEPVEIKFPELTAEHAIQFYSYFRGRKDVYVKRNAKKGYYTQCNNFWKTGIWIAICFSSAVVLSLQPDISRLMMPRG